ncbi:MAG: hypothetical protein JWN23_220 [Rhodocyclales bacterium]|nr:hypothetical protein [Rhodocyclales bacterium]
MSLTIDPRRPAAVHHEHKPWPQQSLTLLAVIGLHLVLAAALLSMQLHAPVIEEPPVLTVHWLPTQRPELPQATPKPKEPPPAKTSPAPVAKPVEPPRAKPVEAPPVQAPAAAPAAVEAPKPPPAPVHAPVAAPAPQQPVMQQKQTPVEPTLRADIDCIQTRPPRYPNADIRDGNEGTVMLRVLTDQQGKMLQVDVLESSKFPGLDRAAQAAVRQWVCPVKHGNQISGGPALIPIVFVLPSP